MIWTDEDGIDLFRADDNLEYNGLDFEGKTENSEFRGGKGERYRCRVSCCSEMSIMAILNHDL